MMHGQKNIRFSKMCFHLLYLSMNILTYCYPFQSLNIKV